MEDERVNVNQADSRGLTPLYTACYDGNIEAIELLLADKRVDVNQETPNGFTPLHIACLNGQTEAIKLLLRAKGVKVNQADSDGYTPLHVACLKGQTEAIELLLADKRVDVNKANINNMPNEIKTIINVAILKAKIIKTLKPSEVDTNLQKEFESLEEEEKTELIASLKLDVEKLAQAGHAYKLKKIISIFPEDKRMEYFEDLAKKVITNCSKQNNLTKINLILDVFEKKDRRMLLNASPTLLISDVASKLTINEGNAQQTILGSKRNDSHIRQ